MIILDMEFTQILLVVAIIVGILILSFLAYITYLLLSILTSFKSALDNINNIQKGFRMIGKRLSGSGEKIGKNFIQNLKRGK